MQHSERFQNQRMQRCCHFPKQHEHSHKGEKTSKINGLKIWKVAKRLHTKQTQIPNVPKPRIEKISCHFRRPKKIFVLKGEWINADRCNGLLTKIRKRGFFIRHTGRAKEICPLAYNQNVVSGSHLGGAAITDLTERGWWFVLRYEPFARDVSKC